MGLQEVTFRRSRAHPAGLRPHFVTSPFSPLRLRRLSFSVSRGADTGANTEPLTFHEVIAVNTCSADKSFTTDYVCIFGTIVKCG